MDPFAPFSLKGKTAIITGGSKGLGKEIARTFAAAGASILLTARTEADLKTASDELAKETGSTVDYLAGEITSPDFAQQLVDHAVQKLGGLHILVNNAGINVRGAIEDVTPEDFDNVMATNVKGPWLLCRAAAPVLKAQNWGRVINLSSALGLVALADRSLYCTSKGAISHFTKELAVEWAKCGITVNAICPGPFETEMNLSLITDPAVKAAFAKHTAMERWGKLDEIGPVALFLASDASSYVTACQLTADGGWVAH